MLCFLALGFLITLGTMYAYLLQRAVATYAAKQSAKTAEGATSKGLLWGAIPSATCAGIVGGLLVGLLGAVVGAVLAGIIGGAVGMMAAQRISKCWTSMFGVGSSSAKS